MSRSPLENEEKLLIQLADGDEAAFEKIIKHYYDHLYDFAMFVTKSSSLAEEIVQDAFLRLWKNRDQVLLLNRFEDWLFIITRNQAYKTLRKEIQRPSFVDELEAYFALASDSPYQQLLLKESRELLMVAATTLPPRQRDIFKMSRLQDYSLDEIAAQLRLSKNTVKVHLTKALHGIRLYLDEHP